jgi:hypothetical protein
MDWYESKTDSMSDLARKQPGPNHLIPSIASSIVTYWRLKSSFEILKFMLVEPDFGYDKWKIVRNLFEFFLGAETIRET